MLVSYFFFFVVVFFVFLSFDHIKHSKRHPSSSDLNRKREIEKRREERRENFSRVFSFVCLSALRATDQARSLFLREKTDVFCLVLFLTVFSKEKFFLFFFFFFFFSVACARAFSSNLIH